MAQLAVPLVVLQVLKDILQMQMQVQPYGDWDPLTLKQ